MTVVLQGFDDFASHVGGDGLPSRFSKSLGPNALCLPNCLSTLLPQRTLVTGATFPDGWARTRALVLP